MISVNVRGIPNLAAIQALYQKPVPRPRENPYETGWDGKHCCYLYTAETLLEWPGVPEFKGDK